MRNTFYNGGQNNSRKPELIHFGSGGGHTTNLNNTTMSTLNHSNLGGHLRRPTVVDISQNNTNISVMSDKYSAMLAQQ